MATKRRLPRGISMYRGKYRVRVFWNNSQPQIGSYGTLTDAKHALAIAKSEIARGVFVPPAERKRQARAAAEEEARKAVTVAQWADRWLSGTGDYKRRTSTVVSYRSILTVHILPVLGDRQLSDVTKDDINDLLEAVRGRRVRYGSQSGNGVEINVERFMRTMFNAAVKAELIDRSPFNYPMPTYKPSVRDSQVASEEEVYALAAAMPERFRLAVHLAAWNQTRISETLAACRGDFTGLDDPETAMHRIERQWNSKMSPTAFTEPKTDAGKRTISVPPHLVPLIQAHLDEYVGDGPEALLFPSSVDVSRPAGHTTLDAAWRTAREAVGRPGFRFHDLRHTGLTIMAQEGATAAELMHRGGHSSLEMALRYQHATVERDRALAARMSRRVRKARKRARRDAEARD